MIDVKQINERQAAMKKLEQSENISSLISIFMTLAACVYMFVMGMYYFDHHEASWIMTIPAILLLTGAMWLIIRPIKMEL